MAEQRPSIAELIAARAAAITPLEETIKAGGASAAMRLYREGVGTQTDLQNRLRTLGYDELQIRSLANQAELEALADDIADGIAALRDGVRAKNITIADFEKELIALGLRGEKAAIYAAREQLRIKPAAGT